MAAPAITMRHRAHGDVAPARDAVSAIAHGFERIGWELRAVEIDMVAGRVVIEAHRFDGRWVYVTADGLGRASVERWHRDAVVYRYRGGPTNDGFEDRFLGRTRCEGPRSALRTLCNYIADNPAPGFSALAAADVRRLIAPLLANPAPTE